MPLIYMCCILSLQLVAILLCDAHCHLGNDHPFKLYFIGLLI